MTILGAWWAKKRRGKREGERRGGGRGHGETETISESSEGSLSEFALGGGREPTIARTRTRTMATIGRSSLATIHLLMDGFPPARAPMFDDSYSLFLPLAQSEHTGLLSIRTLFSSEFASPLAGLVVGILADQEAFSPRAPQGMERFPRKPRNALCLVLPRSWACIHPPLISSCFSLSTTINSGLILLLLLLLLLFFFVVVVLPILPLRCRCCAVIFRETD